jgi:glucose-1-phosphate thymidylyltransferase
MKAIILAAGYATRLYPLTENYPKALLKIAKKPILEYLIDKIAGCSQIDIVTVVTNSRFYSTFEKWNLSRRKKPASGKSLKIEIVSDMTTSNDERIGSIADLWLAIQTYKLDDDLLVLCSDKIFEFSLNDLVDFFIEKGDMVNTVYDTGSIDHIRNKHGCVIVDKDFRIIEFQEKPADPKSTLESIAFYIFPKRMIHKIGSYLAEGGNPDAPGFFTQWVVKREPVYAYIFTEKCYDVGNLESYREVNRIYSAD